MDGSKSIDLKGLLGKLITRASFMQFFHLAHTGIIDQDIDLHALLFDPFGKGLNTVSRGHIQLQTDNPFLLVQITPSLKGYLLWLATGGVDLGFGAQG